MRIVFFGTPELAVPSLEKVAASHTVTAVVCQPDKPKGRSKKLVPPPTKAWATEHDVEVNQPTKLNDGTFEAWLRDQEPDVCVLVAYGRILKQAILDVPAHGFLNMHPSLLPKLRGPSPIQTSVLQGDVESGVTIMRLDAGTDTGDMILQEKADIDIDDTTESLSGKLGKLGADLMLQALERVEECNAVFTPQDDDLATHSKMFEKGDGRIDWERPAAEIHNQVRACIPWPVAQTSFGEEMLRIHKTHTVPCGTGHSPGTVIAVNKGDIHLSTSKDALAIETIQAPGKKAMPMGDYMRGHPISVGDRFGER